MEAGGFFPSASIMNLRIHRNDVHIVPVVKKYTICPPSVVLLRQGTCSVKNHLPTRTLPAATRMGTLTIPENPGVSSLYQKPLHQGCTTSLHGSTHRQPLPT